MAGGKEVVVKAERFRGLRARVFLSPLSLTQPWMSGVGGFALCLASESEGDVPSNEGDHLRR